MNLRCNDSCSNQKRFNNRLKQTPYYMITGRKPDLSKMNIFGLTCYAYKNSKKKLDPKCEKVIFVGYDRNSPAYLVFYPEDNRVLIHRLIKFINNVTNQQTQTYPTDDDDYFPKGSMYKTTHQLQLQTHILRQQKHRIIHRPRKILSFRRERKPLEYVNDYITNSEDDNGHALINFDYCYKATCNIPRIYREAIDSSDAHC